MASRLRVGRVLASHGYSDPRNLPICNTPATEENVFLICITPLSNHFPTATLQPDFSNSGRPQRSIRMGCQSTWLDRATVPFRHVSPLIKGCLGDRFSTWKEGRFVAGVPDRVADQVVPLQATRVHSRQHKDVGVHVIVDSHKTLGIMKSVETPYVLL